MEIRAAAPPPTPLKMATIWGMAVIFTRRAAGTAMAAPMTMATRVSTRFLPEWRTAGSGEGEAHGHGGRGRAEQVPCRACLGELRPLRARMKPMMATR